MNRMWGKFWSGIVALAILTAFVAVPQVAPNSEIFPRMNIMLMFTGLMIAFSAIRSQQTAMFCNSVIFFFIFYPFLIQLIFGFGFAEFGPLFLTNQAFFLGMLFVACFNFTYYVANYSFQVRRSKHRRSASLPVVSGPMLLLISVSSLLVILTLFGADEIFTDRSRYRTSDIERLSSYARFVQNTLKIIPFWAAYFYINGRKGLGKTTPSPVLLASLAISLLISNPVNTQRFISLLGPALVFFAYLESGYFQRIWKRSYLLVAMLLIILPMTSLLRVGKFDASAGRIAESFFSLEFSAFAIFNDLFATNFASTSDANRTLSAIFILIPRSFWASKNEGTGIEVASHAGYVFSNVGIPPLADAYLDLGWLGIVLLAAVSGWAARRAGSNIKNFYANRARLGNGALLSFIALFPIFMRGDLSTFFIAFYSSVTAFGVLRFALSEQRNQGPWIKGA